MAPILSLMIHIIIQSADIDAVASRFRRNFGLFVPRDVLTIEFKDHEVESGLSISEQRLNPRNSYFTCKSANVFNTIKGKIGGALGSASKLVGLGKIQSILKNKFSDLVENVFEERKRDNDNAMLTKAFVKY